jgi:hypothetical protein
VTNGIPLGCPRFLPVHTVNCVQTLKAEYWLTRNPFGIPSERETVCEEFGRQVLRALYVRLPREGLVFEV